MGAYFWRDAVACWPIAWRERWGRLANDLAEREGLDWREAETRAYDQVQAEMTRGDAGDRGDEGEPFQGLLGFGGAA